MTTTNPAGIAVELGLAAVSDACDPAPEVTNNAPGIFPIGVTTVTWTAVDAAGNAAIDTQTVEVTLAPPGGTTVITFDGTPFHAPWSGTLGGIEWPAGQWRTWGGPCGGCQGPLAFPDYTRADPYHVEFSFVQPSVLQAFDAAYYHQDGFVVVRTYSAAGAMLEEARFQVTHAACQTFQTGFTQPAERVEWHAQLGADLGIDNVTYSVPESYLGRTSHGNIAQG